MKLKINLLIAFSVIILLVLAGMQYYLVKTAYDYKTEEFRTELKDKLAGIRAKYPTPEDINDSPHTAPSKRIQNLFPGYDKPIHPLLAAQDIGLDAIRRECPLFNDWVTCLESITN